MYLEYFGFQRLPFTIAPDPEFLFPSQGHQEALAHLSYAHTGHGGLICLTGEVGAGKTTLCRAFMQHLPQHTHLAYIFNPQLSPLELLQSLCDELAVEYTEDATLKSLYAVLNEALLRCYAKGHRVICVIDEAQCMPASLLEQVRLLTNLETDKEKLLTLILVGQPELRDILQRHDLRQLNQRITARYHLNLLSLAECRAYLDHRVQCARRAIEPESVSLFDAAAVKVIWQASRGVPRLINSLADRGLLGAYASSKPMVTRSIANQAVHEVLGEPQINTVVAHPSRFKTVFVTLLILLGLVGLAAGIHSQRNTINKAIAGLNLTSDPIKMLAQTQGIGAETCAAMPVLGYECLWADWSLLELRSLQQPTAVRSLSRGWILLDTSVTDYTGEALILWRRLDGYGGLVRPGQSSVVVSWVRQRLGITWNQDWQSIGPGGKAVTMDDNYYDPILAEAVGNFQQGEELKPDRIIGPRTLLHMQRGAQ
ncbi:ExeA family protein [Thalassolituus sp.]|uniref:ExeA family protein n=1 Tax=Thalassolituus sp. TaxID=2030822 RepID=UPI002A8212C9|nr:AAA family ATPase [Thalassolituus sp.]